jgi:acetyl esterase/lipase
MLVMSRQLLFCILIGSVSIVHAEEWINVWPDLAPGETTRLVGEKMPARAGENPPITRLVNITRPTMTVHKPAHANGTAAVILPGGGFSKVVPDLEGTEAADWLNRHGVAAFVLHYRTTTDIKSPGWVKPLEDA